MCIIQSFLKCAFPFHCPLSPSLLSNPHWLPRLLCQSENVVYYLGPEGISAGACWTLPLGVFWWFKWRLTDFLFFVVFLHLRVSTAVIYMAGLTTIRTYIAIEKATVWVNQCSCRCYLPVCDFLHNKEVHNTASYYSAHRVVLVIMSIHTLVIHEPSAMLQNGFFL